MNGYVKKFLTVSICVLLIVVNVLPVQAAEFLTEEEQKYICERSVIKAASVNGAAPISFVNSDGQIQGIAKLVLDEIAYMTGLIFEYELYDSVKEMLASGADIVYAIPPQYTPDNVKLSQPFLKSATILYVNSSLNLDDMEDIEGKIYAAVEGSDLPEGIKEENVIYFRTREESLDAVEKDQADYGYGNAYSVAYYSLQNGYRNLVTIPRTKETREYCIGMLNDDEILLSIINKSISSIGETRMQGLILEAASQIERKITPGMIIATYGDKIILVSILVIGLLVISIVSSIRANKELRMQNKRHEVLSNISNEYLYEYHIRNERLDLSEKCNSLFGTKEMLDEASRLLKKHLSNIDLGQINTTIKLPVVNGEIKVFKAVNTSILDDMGKPSSIIGKLVDISEEVAEREALVTRSQIDGLTGLYNAFTVKEYITEAINNKDQHSLDAFILLDFDEFKMINDTHGHLVGNDILEQLGKIMKRTFRNSDIIGRMGGDEICAYIKSIPSIKTIREKCEAINTELNEAIEGVNASVSMGVALVREKDTYDNIFKKADQALYIAKGNGKARCQFYMDDELGGLAKWDITLMK